MSEERTEEGERGGAREKNKDERNEKRKQFSHRQCPSVGGRVARKGAIVDDQGRGGVVDRAAAVRAAEEVKR